MDQKVLQKSPASSLDLEKEVLDEVAEDGIFECKNTPADGESVETTVDEACKEQEEKRSHRKQPHDELDPRIQEELEHLNEASEEINQLELQLHNARSHYRKILTDSARKLNAQNTQLGTCIEKARPYYEARRLAKEAQQKTQNAALGYERAVSMHAAAREMVFVAEQGMAADKTLDQTWQEMLNHATAKVNEAEDERVRSECEHMRVTQLCQAAEAHVQTLQKTLKRAIVKSKPYFELKSQFNSILEEHKQNVTKLEEHVSEAKRRYSITLRHLEKISEEIHAQRELDHPEEESRKGIGARSPPVGAEAVVSTRNEGGLFAGRTEINDCMDGEEGVVKTVEWVERHRKTGWWESEKERTTGGEVVSSDSLSVSSFKTIASDLEKCDSVDHLGQLSDTLSLSGEEEEKGKRCEEKRGINDKKMDNLEQEKQEQLLRQHQRSVSL
ncbi:SH3-binding domain protein 5-like, a [Electrophorus electricus]|uniref:SH3 domain-binding protein 5 n=1 Tax=Electrophorus electricus TaxID=8005 RepID=A0A4W4GVF8_ELEEL|nr:SH3-binding domain protein 5-like, a [Electrophorus electricus]